MLFFFRPTFKNMYISGAYLLKCRTMTVLRVCTWNSLAARHHGIRSSSRSMCDFVLTLQRVALLPVISRVPSLILGSSYCLYKVLQVLYLTSLHKPNMTTSRIKQLLKKQIKNYPSFLRNMAGQLFARKKQQPYIKILIWKCKTLTNIKNTELNFM